MPWLNEQINLMSPKIIILAGATAVESYLGIKEPISKIRGKWIEKNNVKYMPIFHPSYLLRNPSKDKGKPKWLTWQDLKKVKKELSKLKELNSSFVITSKEKKIKNEEITIFKLNDSLRKITPVVTPTIGTK